MNQGEGILQSCSKEDLMRTPVCEQTKQFEPKTELQGSKSRSYIGTRSKSALTDTEKEY